MVAPAEGSRRTTQNPSHFACFHLASFLRCWKWLQILLWALKMGNVSVFLSDILVSGFTTGAAVHVATSQLKHVFGLPVPRHDGPGKILRVPSLPSIPFSHVKESLDHAVKNHPSYQWLIFLFLSSACANVFA